jgi:hypothetical protein
VKNDITTQAPFSAVTELYREKVKVILMKYPTKEIYDKYIYCNKNDNGCIFYIPWTSTVVANVQNVRL